MARKRNKPRLGKAADENANQQLKAALSLVHNNQPQKAVSAFQELIRNFPGNPSIHFYYGNLLWALKQPQLAAEQYMHAVKIKADYSDALCNLGAALFALGKQQEAINCYKKVIKLDPTNADAYHNLGGSYSQQGKYSEAETAFREAIRIKPDYADAYKNLGNTYYEHGYFAEAAECYKKVVKLVPSNGAKIRLATAIPMIPESTKHIDEIRLKLRNNIDSLLSQNLHIKDPISENCYTNFFLAYHGKNNRLIQEKYARLYSQACPSLTYTAKHCRDYKVPATRKIRIGFISKFFMDHSIGNTSVGLIANLSKEKFHVTAFFLGSIKGRIGYRISECADQTVIIPNDLNSSRKIISELKLDILFYQDIGIEPFTYFLAYSRLAPVQCVSFGHPDTTGITNMDYFISTEFYEPNGADNHYSESLYRLKDVSSCAYYYRPNLPKSLRPRSHFGLDSDKNIYICPQTLFKFHPEFDHVMANILRADPDGLIVLIEGKYPHWAELLIDRFKTTIPDVRNRIQFVPFQTGDDFINLIAVSDVMLDTIHFCGQNTSHAGFSAGVPIVTLPGEFHRGRHTLGFYKSMGFMDCVADSEEDYVNIAVRLATDSKYRSEIVNKILKYRDVIWEEHRVVDEFEKFFTGTVHKFTN